MHLARRAGTAVLLLGLATGVAGCGSEPEVCGDLDALRADLDQLQDVRIEPGALAELSSDLDQVVADLRSLASSAASQYDTQVDAVRSAARALGDSVETAVQAPSGAALTQVSSNVEGLVDAVGDLGDALSTTC